MPRSYADFARPTYADPRWLETHWFSAVTEESKIRLHFWMGFRSNLGVAVTKVYAYSQISDSMLDMDLNDMQYHSPIGANRLSDFSLSSGVSVRARSVPHEYDLRYRSSCGRLEADLHYTSIMEPVDLDFTAIADATEGFVAFHRKFGVGSPENRSGTEPTGHIDQTMRVTGQVVVDGEVHSVDCVSNRDHSWSPRGEVGHGIGGYDEIHFGEDLNACVHTAKNAFGGYDVSHAYVVRHGEARKVTKASVTYERDGFRVTSARYELLDEKGEEYVITGSPRASATLDGGQNIFLVMDLLDCEWNGLQGYSEVQWHDWISRLQGERRAKAVRD